MEAVGAALLLVGPSLRQVGGRGQLVVDDGAVPHGRSQQAVTARHKRLEKVIEPFALQKAGLVLGGHGENLTAQTP